MAMSEKELTVGPHVALSEKELTVGTYMTLSEGTDSRSLHGTV
jgi:hypothetical protein